MPLHMIDGGHRVVQAFFDSNAVGFRRPKAIRFVSGILSPGAYINNRTLPSHQEEWQQILTPLFAQARKLRNDYDVIASVATGGVPHGIAIARELMMPHVIVKKQEKTHGLGGLIDGDTLILKGGRILLVEDMASTLSSTLKAMRPLEHEGATIAHTLLLNTWDLPDFRHNIGEHSLHVLCTGAMYLDWATTYKLLDDEHAAIVRHWLEHPEDEGWAKDCKWVLPEEKK